MASIKAHLFNCEDTDKCRNIREFKTTNQHDLFMGDVRDLPSKHLVRPACSHSIFIHVSFSTPRSQATRKYVSS